MQKDDNDDRRLITISVFIIVLIIGLWIFTFLSLIGKSESARGTFGDMFGGVNALFSGLAFGGIIITILLQRKELALQREELKNTRIELERTANAQDAQHIVMLSQQYQTTFFHLLEGHATLSNNFNFSKSSGVLGISLFYNTILEETMHFAHRIKTRSFPEWNTTHYNPYYTLLNNHHFFDAIFGDLITLMKFVDEKLPDILYHEIIFNHLSIYERYLIGLYCDCFADDYSDFIKNHSSDITSYYRNQHIKYTFSEDTYFPAVKIQKSNLNRISLKDLKPESTFLDFTIECPRNVLDEVLFLHNVKVQGKNNEHTNKEEIFTVSISDTFEPIMITGKEKVFLAPYLFNHIIRLPKQFSTLNFDFAFEFKNQYYIVNYKMDLTIQNESSGVSLLEKFLTVTDQK